MCNFCSLCMSFRAYLIPDGRQEDLVMPLIPAEGALFATNYRIVFKGTPIDPYLCEHTVIRAFPIASLSKDKKFTLPKGMQSLFMKSQHALCTIFLRLSHQSTILLDIMNEANSN